MEQFTIKLKDLSKRKFLFELLAQFDFIEFVSAEKEAKTDVDDFFSSAGLFEGREMDAKELRKKAWRIQD